MKLPTLARLATLFQILLIPVCVMAAPLGESTGEIWVDGPDDVQPGSDPQHPDAAVNSMY